MTLVGDDMTTQEGTEFVVWLKKEMERRGWGVTKLARESGLHAGSISNILHFKRQPEPDTCRALARAFNLPESFVLEMAGHLSPPAEADNLEFRRLQQIMREMSQEQREEILLYAFQISKRKETRLELLRLLQETRQLPDNSDQDEASE